jgi:hypothetical protein
MALTRRAFGFGLLGTLALGVLGGLPLAWASVDEDRVLYAAIEALFPGEGLPSPADVDAGGNLRRYLAELPEDVSLQARGLLRLVEGLPLTSRGAPFSSLPVRERTAVLEELSASSLLPRRLVAHSLKQLCAMSYWQHPKTWAHLGYDGPLVGR